MCECTYDSRRDHRRTRNHNEQFSLVEKCSLVYIYIYVSITWLKKKINRKDSEGFENEYDRD